MMCWEGSSLCCVHIALYWVYVLHDVLGKVWGLCITMSLQLGQLEHQPLKA